MNDVISCLTEKTKAAHRISTAYHPQTNGLVERFNKTVQSIIITTCSEQQDDWDENIEEILFSYRTMVHSTMKKTPFEIMFGRIPMPEMNGITDDASHFENTVSKLKEQRHAIEKDVKENIAKSQDKQILRFHAQNK